MRHESTPPTRERNIKQQTTPRTLPPVKSDKTKRMGVGESDWRMCVCSVRSPLPHTHDREREKGGESKLNVPFRRMETVLPRVVLSRERGRAKFVVDV